jgi:hypothetical protein
MLSAAALLCAKIEMRLTYVSLVNARARHARCRYEREVILPEVLWDPATVAEMTAKVHDAEVALAAAKCEKTALRLRYETLHLAVDRHRKYAPAIAEAARALEAESKQDVLAHIMQHIEKLDIVYTSLC